jgi:methylated-DNA-protein-cysteine methyltransferase-like protein
MTDSDFRERVLELIQQIPRGKVASYGQIARLAGHPRAPRQVGRILYGQNLEGLPWHRVVNFRGELSTWKIGSGELQQALLESEGVKFKQGCCNLKRFQWGGPEEAEEEPSP